MINDDFERSCGRANPGFSGGVREDADMGTVNGGIDWAAQYYIWIMSEAPKTAFTDSRDDGFNLRRFAGGKR